MAAAATKQAKNLAARLKACTTSDPEYWSFRGNAKRDHCHGLMQYPAMMVPQMVRALLDEVCSVKKNLTRVGDPFVGSGTVLTEATLRGLNFIGRDINPLALLLCRVKSGPIFPEALIERADELVRRIKADRKHRVEAQFPGIDKWFKPEVKQSLSRIRRAVRDEQSVWARRFFWVALAETVRLSSNSRTSTFKLHIRSRSDLVNRVVEAEETYTRVLTRNLSKFSSLAATLREKAFLIRGHYAGQIKLALGDARLPLQADGEDEQCDLIITSPPYGDNATTVPYGQYSYLPLQWIDLCDIQSDIDTDCLRTTHELDHRSLGGSRRLPPDAVAEVRDHSPTLARALDRLRNEPRDRARRLTAFARDLGACVPHALSMLRLNGLMIWVLGNRRIAGKSVPLDGILSDFIRENGGELVARLRRSIPSKRMAIRNSVAETMGKETILVFRKAK
ncbi:MAG: site-specific DNA-methyltransferase [Planctomycetes bacterium]|nr:site-specific DNA-methyltransferase [Planctomycetota bacterium]